MPAHTSSSSRSSLALGLGLAAAAGAALAPYGVAVAQLGSDANGARGAVAHLANGSRGGLVMAAYVAAGVAALLLAQALRSLLHRTEAARAGGVALRIWGAGLVVAGLCRIDTADRTVVGGAHVLAGAIASIAAVLAVLLLARGFRHDARWTALRPLGVAAGVVMLATLVAQHLVPVEVFGAVQRTFLAVAELWLLAVAFRVASLASDGERHVADLAPWRAAAAAS